MSKHTPGPWKAHQTKEKDLEFGLIVNTCVVQEQTDISGRLICESWGKATCLEQEEMANARLIAAAPEMLEALKLCVDALADDEQSVPMPLRIVSLGSALRHARAVIAKAEVEA